MKKGQGAVEGIVSIMIMLTILYGIILVCNAWITKMDMLSNARNGTIMLSGGGKFEDENYNKVNQRIQNLLPPFERNFNITEYGIFNDITHFLYPDEEVNYSIILTMNRLFSAVSGISGYMGSCEIDGIPYIGIRKLNVKANSYMVGNPWAFQNFVDFLKDAFEIDDNEGRWRDR